MMFNQNGEDRGLGAIIIITQNHNIRMLTQNLQCLLHVHHLTLLNPLPSQIVMKMQCQSIANRSNDVRSTSLLTLGQYLGIAMKRFTHIEDSTTTRSTGNLIQQELLLEDQQTRTAHTTHHLMRREEEGICVILGIDGCVVHQRSLMRSSRCTIPADQSTFLVSEDVHGGHGRDQTRNVADMVERDNTKRATCHY